MSMNRKKTISLILGIFGLIIGIVMIIAEVMDLVVPKPLYLLFALVSMTNAIVILMNFKNKGERDTK